MVKFRTIATFLCFFDGAQKLGTCFELPEPSADHQRREMDHIYIRQVHAIAKMSRFRAEAPHLKISIYTTYIDMYIYFISYTPRGQEVNFDNRESASRCPKPWPRNKKSSFLRKQGGNSADLGEGGSSFGKTGFATMWYILIRLS